MQRISSPGWGPAWPGLTWGCSTLSHSALCVGLVEAGGSQGPYQPSNQLGKESEPTCRSLWWRPATSGVNRPVPGPGYWPALNLVKTAVKVAQVSLKERYFHAGISDFTRASFSVYIFISGTVSTFFFFPPNCLSVRKYIVAETGKLQIKLMLSRPSQKIS